MDLILIDRDNLKYSLSQKDIKENYIRIRSSGFEEFFIRVMESTKLFQERGEEVIPLTMDIMYDKEPELNFTGNVN